MVFILNAINYSLHLNAQTDETKCNNNNTSMSAKYTEYLIIPFVCMT